MKPDSSPYRAGDVFRFPAYADTMRSLVETNCESYYRGELTEKIVALAIDPKPEAEAESESESEKSK